MIIKMHNAIDDKMLKVDNFSFDKVYFGMPQYINPGMELNHPLVVTPYKAIASIFAVACQKEELGIPDGRGLHYGYDEWGLPTDQLTDYLKELHMIVRGCPDMETHDAVVSGYVYTIDASKIKDNIYRYTWMNPEREFMVAGIDHIDFDEIHKVTIKVNVHGEDDTIFEEVMTNQKKENRLSELLKNPNDKYSTEISNIIDDHIKRHKNVWLMGDWHLFLRDEKGKSKCHKRSDFDQIINHIRSKVHDDDLLINLGDLVDGEFRDKDILKNIISHLPGTKILVKGNNDVFDANFYKSCGFSFVVESFIWKNVLFTHMPVENNYDVNVHAHIHGYRTYWIPYTNQVDIAAFGGRKEPVSMMKVITGQKQYSKTVKEVPERFDEYVSNDIFGIHIGTNNEDPYHDNN